LALVDALKRNTSVKSINLNHNQIGSEGASALADALKVNTSITTINLRNNSIGAEGEKAIADALKVNTSVTRLYIDNTRDAAASARAYARVERNRRLRRLFLFDARQMLLSVLCADECGVVWPYLLEGDDLDYVAQASNCFGDFTSVRTEYAVVVEERRRRAAVAVLDQTSDDNVDGGSVVVKRRRTIKRPPLICRHMVICTCLSVNAIKTYKTDK
jgi:hypothetical protein